MWRNAFERVDYCSEHGVRLSACPSVCLLEILGTLQKLNGYSNKIAAINLKLNPDRK